MLNLVKNQAKTCYSLASSADSIKLVGTNGDETLNISTTASGNWLQFDITTTLDFCIGDYYLYNGATEVERGKIKILDPIANTDIEHDPRD